MKQIPLTKGLFTIVDDLDYERVSKFKWCAQKIGTKYYAVRGAWSNRKTNAVFLHRFLTNAPPGILVDHVNGNGLDNRNTNLRLCTVRQNLQNRPAQLNNKSGFKGVSYSKDRNKWVAAICINGKQTALGRFNNKIDAAKAYDTAAKLHFGEFAFLNFPEV
jgi:hypothetical protein